MIYRIQLKKESMRRQRVKEGSQICKEDQNPPTPTLPQGRTQSINHELHKQQQEKMFRIKLCCRSS